MTRIIIQDDNGINIEELLDSSGVDYDYDGFDRLMVEDYDADYVLEKLEEYGVDADVV